MKKVTRKLWIYGIGFLMRGLIFNFALAFTIVALVKVHDGFTIWAIIAIALSSFWIFQNVFNHIIWSTLSKNERALYFGIRRFGSKVVQVTEKEISRRTGQQDLLEMLRDTDSSLEVQMAINGAFTLINVFIGIKWIINAIQFNKNIYVFEYKIIK
ncbi:MAG: hypothetical protein HRT99_01590 [Mycoplasmatales bacterium]|nr:hypothetical protein [Mycoplasmatales bacterium]